MNVSFGNNTIVFVENVSKYYLWSSSFIEHLRRYTKNISFIRESYKEEDIRRLSDLIIEISKHEDVSHVDIYIDKNNNDKFIFDMVSMLYKIFDHYDNKSANIVQCDYNLFCFYDGYSNPSLDENLKIEERWEIRKCRD